MPLPINPMIDSAFKALFANKDHSHLLVSLLNAIVQPAARFMNLEYLDPIDKPSHLGGRTLTVDVKVRDEEGHIFQIEVQIVLHNSFLARTLYGWSRMYAGQLLRGENYGRLRPVTSVWILDRQLHKEHVHHHYIAVSQYGYKLPHFNIHMIELANLKGGFPNNVLEHWLYFLKNARGWEELPEGVESEMLEEAMQVLKRFSEDDAEFFRYQREEDREREDATRLDTEEKLHEALTEQAVELANKDAALANKDAALANKDAALANKDAVLTEQAAALAEQVMELAEQADEVARLNALVRQLKDR